MILGRGSATGDAAIIEDYQRFLDTCSDITASKVERNVRAAPQVMLRRIGKPLAGWTDNDILSIVTSRHKSTTYYYAAFLAFLFFRGYRRASLDLLTALPVKLVLMHHRALLPHRQKLETAQRELGYSSEWSVGSVLTLLIYLLSVVHKPLNELTRSDFDSFRMMYTDWYRLQQHRKNGKTNARLTRLEYYLVHWGVLPPTKVTFRHEEHFAQLRHPLIRQAILTYMRWCDAKFQPSTIYSGRAGVLGFFRWFQSSYPQATRLDEVTRQVALSYATFLNSKVYDGTYSSKYRNDLYRRIRLFFEFSLIERLESSPDRNPFARADLPNEPDPVPRYLTDQEVRAILTYCDGQASPLQRVIIITLLHTGVRASELAALKVTDIVEIQGRCKLHIHAGKGLKDRMIPLTDRCLHALRDWQTHGWEQVNDYLFTRHGRPWRTADGIRRAIYMMADTLGLTNITPHRFRHTFAVALLNYGMKESALQKLMGHATLNMTLEYARILDRTVERAFTEAVEQMQVGPLGWVPSFFATEEYTLFEEGDTLNWIRLPHGYCRRNPKLHCESDVKCVLCDRFVSLPTDLPRLREMHERFVKLGLQAKVDVLAVKIQQLELQISDDRISLQQLRVSAQ